MKSLLSRIAFPALVTVSAIAATLTPGRYSPNELNLSPKGVCVADTVVYPHDGYKKGWTAEDFRMSSAEIADSLKGADSLGFGLEDSVDVILFRDTVKVPDSLRFTDPFRYKYYAALVDSATHRWVRDTLIAAGDTLDLKMLDSLYYADSAALAKLRFEQWYAGLSKTDRKKYEMNLKAQAKLAEMDSLQAVHDSIQNIKDSILQNTPRILETDFLPDSLMYKRILTWSHERKFHDMEVTTPDTSFNSHFHDYKFQREDVNATWLGVAGSPVQTYNYFLRENREQVFFYQAQESWTKTPENIPMYNTKTPYTELSYTGTLLSGTQKESNNLHLMTTQNINPDFNFTLCYDRFGGNGILADESTINKTFYANTNILGKRYLMHAGYIYNMVSRSENGGILDNYWIRDTTVDAREINVALSDASSKIKKNTLFLDQQYRIPFDFLKKKDAPDSSDVTTAFIGHSSEYSVYTRTYTDALSAGKSSSGSSLFDDRFYVNPNSTADSMRVMKLDNKAFIRLQPWSEDGVISKLDVGVGDKYLSFYKPEVLYLKAPENVVWNTAYAYAGVKGRLTRNLHWDATADYSFAGAEFNDKGLAANAELSLYPFRRARTSPVSIKAHFETSSREPEYYQQHLLTNHYMWDNEFGKVSTTKLQGSLDIPRWRLSASAGYALLVNNLYYDTLGIIRQNTKPMSVLSVALRKEFVLWNTLHLDNKALFQLSSDEDVMPLPTLALNLRYYLEFNVKKDVMKLQLGANGFWNTAWYSPAWNPALGVFRNQTEIKYNNGPYIDAFVNVQWKRACVFIKLENAAMGLWPDRPDYFSAHHYINTTRTVKFGIWWPFYMQAGKNMANTSSSTSNNRSSSGGGAPTSRSGGPSLGMNKATN
jgi:hypothetical protein